MAPDEDCNLGPSPLFPGGAGVVVGNRQNTSLALAPDQPHPLPGVKLPLTQWHLLRMSKSPCDAVHPWGQVEKKRLGQLPGLRASLPSSLTQHLLFLTL